jgi:hypothetical protein
MRPNGDSLAAAAPSGPGLHPLTVHVSSMRVEEHTAPRPGLPFTGGYSVRVQHLAEPAVPGDWHVLWFRTYLGDPASAGVVGGLRLVIEERLRQVIEQRYTPEWDDAHHPDGSLVRMAADIVADVLDEPAVDARHRLAVAAAFLAAEIDRLTRTHQNDLKD